MILAFYAILLGTPLIACESFMEALLSGFQRIVCRLARPRIDGLNGLRPTLRVGALLARICQKSIALTESEPLMLT
jgi:hypothetical protein